MEERKRITIVLSIICVALNLGIALVKYLVGLRVNSICILLDATNNFFDMTSSVVTLIAFLLVYRKRSERFPYGFGRSEYISGFVVSTVAVVVGFNFFWNSFSRLVMPEPVWFSTTNLFLIVGTIPFKLAIGIVLVHYNKKTQSKAFSAIIVDTFLDVGITSVSVSSYVLSGAVSYAYDAWLGIGIGIIVIAVSVKLILENLRAVIGGASCEEEKEKIIELCKSYSQIVEIAKIQLHDYGYRACYGFVYIGFVSNLSKEEKLKISDELSYKINQSTGANIEFAENLK